MNFLTETMKLYCMLCTTDKRLAQNSRTSLMNAATIQPVLSGRLNNHQHVRSPNTSKNQDPVRLPNTSKNQDQVRLPNTSKNQDQVRSPNTSKNHDQVRSPNTSKNQNQARWPNTRKNQDQVTPPRSGLKVGWLGCLLEQP